MNTNIEKFLDSSSFIEMGGFHKSSNVITGYGTIDRRLVYVYSQQGAVNSAHSKKIAALYKLALTMGAPVIAFLDSKGIDLNQGFDVFAAYGEIFSAQSEASGVIPQISIISGDCLGVATYMPFLSDFVIMTESESKLLMSSPQILSGVEGKWATFESLGSASTHIKQTGLVHLICENEDGCIQSAQELLSYLPSNNMEDAPLGTSNDDLNREGINEENIIPSIVDDNIFFELRKGLSENFTMGFGRFNGYSTGIISVSDILGSTVVDAITSFVRFCDAYNIPILTLTDVIAYSNTVEEQLKIIQHCGRMLYSFSNATVPKVNVITKNAIGSPYLIMNSKHIGADIVYAWQGADISMFSKEAKKNVIGAEENRDECAEKGYIDDVIAPRITRKRVIAALEMLSSKKVTRYPRKHNSSY